MSLHLTPARTAIIKKQTNNKTTEKKIRSVDQDVEKFEYLCILVEMQGGASNMKTGMEFPQNIKIAYDQQPHSWVFILKT